MSEQICLFDIIKAPEKAKENKSDIEGWTFDDLKRWAARFDLEWVEEEYLDDVMALFFRKGRSEMSIHIGKVVDLTVDRSLPDEFLPAIHFDWWNAKQQAGGGAAYTDLDKLEERIRAIAPKLDTKGAK